METERQEHRMIAWREQKRQEGYQQVTVWLKADMKHLLDDLATQRREDLSETITAAIVALAGTTPARARQAGPDYTVIQRMIDETVTARLAGVPPLESPSPSAAARQRKDPTYGSLTRNVHQMARQLRRFGNLQMAKAVHAQPASVNTILKNAIIKGLARKEGYTYIWLEADAGESEVV